MAEFYNGVSGLLSLGTGISQQISSLRNAAHDTPAELAAVAHELNDLNSVLGSLEASIRTKFPPNSPSPFANDVARDFAGALDQGRWDLNQLQTTVQKLVDGAQGVSFARIWGKVQSFFAEKELEAACDALVARKGTLNITLMLINNLGTGPTQQQSYLPQNYQSQPYPPQDQGGHPGFSFQGLTSHIPQNFIPHQFQSQNQTYQQQPTPAPSSYTPQSGFSGTHLAGAVVAGAAIGAAATATYSHHTNSSPDLYQNPPANQFHSPPPNQYQGPPPNQYHSPPPNQFHSTSPNQLQSHPPPPVHSAGQPPPSFTAGGPFLQANPVYGQHQRRYGKQQCALDAASQQSALMAAVDPGNETVVEQLLENGFDANSKDILQRAAWNGHLKVLQLLLDFGCNINSVDYNKKSALVCACERGRLEIVEELLRRGADPNLLATVHPLIAGGDSEDIIERLLQFGADPNAKDVITRYGWDGHLEPIKLLLSYGCHVDALDYNKKSALVCACERGRVEIAKVLLEHRADPNFAATSAPLMAARDHEEIVKLLLQYGVSPSTKDIATRMAWDGNFDSLKVLIEAGCPVDIIDLNKVTPLHAASERGRTEIVEYLLGQGADPNLPATNACLMAGRYHPDAVKHLLDFGADPNTKDVLTLAAWDDCLDTITHMLDAGADVNIKDHNKTTPLHAACQRERPEIVKTLLERGADPNLLGPESPLKAGRRNGEITKLLLSFGANPFDPDLLPVVAWDEGLDSVSHLLDAGADVNVRDKNKHTALWAAVERNYEEIALLLLNRGADPNLMVVLPRAAWHGNLNVVRRLVEGGAWINAKNDNGQTALQLAASGGKSDVLQFLLDRGASQ